MLFSRYIYANNKTTKRGNDMNTTPPREGDIHEVVHIGDHSFTIRYGYYSDAERCTTEPIPIYPCFLSDPHYTGEGHPLVTRIQDACEHYTPAEGNAGDEWCADCIHCTNAYGGIGICKSPHRKNPEAAHS